MYSIECYSCTSKQCCLCKTVFNLQKENLINDFFSQNYVQEAVLRICPCKRIAPRCPKYREVDQKSYVYYYFGVFVFYLKF